MKNELQILFKTVLDHKNKQEIDTHQISRSKYELEEILKNLGTKNTELIIYALKENNDQELISKISEVFYHLFVLMAEKSITLDDVNEELGKYKNK